MYISKKESHVIKTAIKMTSIRLDMKLANEAAKILGAKNRTEAVHIALKEVVALKKFKEMMTRSGGKLKFEAYDR